MRKLFSKKWSVVISVFIIISTFFYTMVDKNSNKQATVETIDTKIFKTNLQPKINELTTNYNDIIEKDWLPAWEDININGDSVDRTKLLSTMNSVSKQYETIIKEIDTIQIEENIVEVHIKSN